VTFPNDTLTRRVQNARRCPVVDMAVTRQVGRAFPSSRWSMDVVSRQQPDDVAELFELARPMVRPVSLSLFLDLLSRCGYGLR
jgi:hypothetical protein